MLMRMRHSFHRSVSFLVFAGRCRVCLTASNHILGFSRIGRASICSREGKDILNWWLGLVGIWIPGSGASLRNPDDVGLSPNGEPASFHYAN